MAVHSIVHFCTSITSRKAFWPDERVDSTRSHKVHSNWYIRAIGNRSEEHRRKEVLALLNTILGSGGNCVRRSRKSVYAEITRCPCFSSKSFRIEFALQIARPLVQSKVSPRSPLQKKAYR